MSLYNIRFRTIRVNFHRRTEPFSFGTVMKDIKSDRWIGFYYLLSTRLELVTLSS